MPVSRRAIAIALMLALTPPVALAQSAATKAKSLFQAGEVAYNTGDFEKAIGLYQQAYALKALPGLLFNIGQGYRQLGNFERAAFFFSRYLDTAGPRDANLDNARALLEEATAKQAEAKSARQAEEERARLEAERLAAEAEARRAEAARKELEALAPKPAPGRALVEPSPPQPVYQRWWFWTVLGVGAAGAAGGGYAAYDLTARPPDRAPATLGDIGRARP